MNPVKYSVIVPVYNRPNEVEELLHSLTKQQYTGFEVLVVEDGSSHTCEHVVEQYSGQFRIHYFRKPNTGPGPSRNFGYAHARGAYFVCFDSDCIIPPHYFIAVEEALHQHQWEAWGGPDKAHEHFTPLQQAMGYTMASVLTTGGIRGGKKRLGWFQPRSFNMGIARHVYEQTQGFKFDRYAEDIEFSIRMKNAGFRVGLIPEAFVYHKRRTSFSQFYQQVSNFGKGRALIGKAYPAEVKLTHWFPAFFVLGCLTLPILPFIHTTLAGLAWSGFLLYMLAIFADALRVTRNLYVSFLSVPAAFLQLTGYGIGFLKERLNTSGIAPRVN
jgi:glycosyltransferase involved in cell wall biosynthesis